MVQEYSRHASRLEGDIVATKERRFEAPGKQISSFLTTFMAALEKLAIRGIRSFDDKRLEVIQFFTPVTVIVGQNGSGKTTIIECLKYATTGDQPPNTRGGAFVHDPKMAAEKEVKAQVKLRFRAANGKPMLVTRNLSVTLKKNAGMTMKTLEALLSAIPEDGDDRKRTTVSAKCAEMDVEIPNLLGVSKAVLDNVIFCHQEDSYWPLAEASVLKKKFDEIFEASKYTKALDAIKNLRKERVSELKVDKERLEGALREKHHADKLKKRISDLNATVAAKVLDYEELKNRAEALALENKEFYEKAVKFRDIFRQVEAAEARLSQLQTDRRDISDNLDILEGTDATLEDRRRDFEHHVNSQRATRDRKIRYRQDEEERVADLQRQLGGEQKREGQFAAAEQNHQKNVAKRAALVRDVGQKNGLAGFNREELSQEEWLDFRSRIGEVQRRHTEKLESLQLEGQDKNQEFNVKLQSLQGNIAALKAEAESLHKQIAERQQAITHAESKTDDIQRVLADLKRISSEAEQKREQITRLQKEMASSGYQAKLEEKAAMGRKLDDEREKLSNELTSLTQQMESRTSLSLKKEESQKLSAEIQSILEGMGSRYQQQLGRKPQAETIERELDRTISEKERELRDLEVDANHANRKLAQIEGTISNQKKKQKQMEEEVKSLDKKLAPLRGEHPTLSAALADTQEQARLCQDEIAKLTDMAKFYEEVLRHGRNERVCTSCNRHIADREMKEFEDHVSSILRKDKTVELTRTQEELAGWEKEAERLQRHLSTEAAYINLKEIEIPSIIKEQKKIEGSLEDASNESKSLTERVEGIKSALKILQSLKQQGAMIGSMIKRRELALQFIQEKKAELQVDNSVKSLEEIKAELAALGEKQHTIERERQALISERENHSRILQGYQTELHRLEMEKSECNQQVKEGERLEAQTEDNRKYITMARTRIKDVEAKRTQAHEPLEDLKREQRAFDLQHRSHVNEAQQILNEISISIQKLDDAAHSVEEYIKDQGARKLKRCQEKIVELQEAIQHSSENIATYRAEEEALTHEVSSANTTLSNLKDNIRLRKIKREIQAVETEKAGLDLEEASRARQEFDEKYLPKKAAEEEANRQSQHLQGELASLRTQLKEIERDAREYKDATKKYTEQLIKTKMADMVNNDLEKYAKALDSAIMKYHSIKMAEVNDTMRHLWNRTYQGTDIDGIKIVSEGDGGTGRRTYNYRVVMVKDQVEMDMRGRCSAGQKMLASIIIRLALADSFGANCGILALDEPTNALDVDNIEALAHSLIDIIRERREQANFQLIIITHDENFLRKLGEASVIEYYWRVSRDARQKSTVEKQAISL